jgi:hypothetical protein
MEAESNWKHSLFYIDQPGFHVAWVEVRPGLGMAKAVLLALGILMR